GRFRRGQPDGDRIERLHLCLLQHQKRTTAMKAVIWAMFLFLPGTAAAITPAELIEQAKRSVASSEKDPDRARAGLAHLMARHPEIAFGTPIERTSTASDVLPIFIVRLDQLKTFTESSVATDFLTPTGRAYWRVYYPSSTPGDRRVTLSSVELRQVPGGWE